MDEASDIPTKRRIDGVTAIMVVVTAASLLGAAWLRTRRPPENEPPAVGALAPPLRLLDLETSEPIVLVGLRGKVVWVVFWSADSPSAQIEPGGDRARLELAQGPGTVCHGGGGRRGRQSRSRPRRGRRKRRQAAGLSGQCRDPATVWRSPGRPSPERADRRRWAYRDASPAAPARRRSSGSPTRPGRLLDELGPADDTRFASQ